MQIRDKPSRPLHVFLVFLAKFINHHLFLGCPYERAGDHDYFQQYEKPIGSQPLVSRAADDLGELGRDLPGMGGRGGEDDPEEDGG